VKNYIVLISLIVMGLPAAAAVRSFRIHFDKQITAQVDRFYGADQNAFATLFCRADAAEVMFVDGRVPELDGVNFYFASPQACYEARQNVRDSYHRCVTELQLDTVTNAAKINISSCR
jgi:hypothetical protein